MNKLAVLKTTISKAAGRSGLVAKKYSPEMLIGAGIVGIVASTVLACRATLKVEEVLDEAQEKITKIKAVHNEEVEIKPGTTYTEQDYKKDLTVTYVQTGLSFVKLYAPAVTLGVASICCILGAHNIMKKRNVAIVAAYKAVEGSFKDYRRRVVSEFGEDKDRQFRYGINHETVTEVENDEDGKAKKVKKIVESADPNHYSQYARFFDEACTNWSKTPEYNALFLKAQQNYANDMLHAKGHLFLNEVYDLLGVPRSQAGAVTGWLMGNGDDFVDFGIYNLNSEAARDFVNGYERSILLDFNVDGVIFDMI